MSHEVTDLEPVFEFLDRQDSTSNTSWEVRYISFVWLSLICMIPFDLKRIDSANKSQVQRRTYHFSYTILNSRIF